MALDVNGESSFVKIFKLPIYVKPFVAFMFHLISFPLFKFQSRIGRSNAWMKISVLEPQYQGSVELEIGRNLKV